MLPEEAGEARHVVDAAGLAWAFQDITLLSAASGAGLAYC